MSRLTTETSVTMLAERPSIILNFGYLVHSVLENFELSFQPPRVIERIHEYLTQLWTSMVSIDADNIVAGKVIPVCIPHGRSPCSRAPSQPHQPSYKKSCYFEFRFHLLLLE